MDAATLGGLGLLALLDSTSVGPLVLPLVLLAQPVVRSRRVVLYLATVGAFYLRSASPCWPGRRGWSTRRAARR